MHAFLLSCCLAGRVPCLIRYILTCRGPVPGQQVILTVCGLVTKDILGTYQMDWLMCSDIGEVVSRKNYS